MQQITLTVPDKKLPLFKSLLSSNGIENKGGEDFLQKTTYQSNASATLKDIANSYYNNHISWEYFSNELEFE